MSTDFDKDMMKRIRKSMRAESYTVWHTSGRSDSAEAARKRKIEMSHKKTLEMLKK